MLNKVKQTVKSKLINRFESDYEKRIRNGFKKNLMKWCDKELNKEQKDEIQSFYTKNFGRKIDLAYHTYYYHRNGIFSPLYLPSSIYKAYVVGRLNDLRVKDAYIDKNKYDSLFPQIKHPKTIIKCINGFYYHNNYPISMRDAVKLCGNLDDVIIKPSLDSIHGSKVLSISTEKGKLEDGSNVENLFNYYGKHFIIQERVKQHDLMSALNPTSVNTIRLLTYRRGDNIELLYAVVRIGRKGEIIDNESSGGVTTKINSDGTLNKYLYAPPSEGVLEKTDSGVKVDGFLIPSYNKIVETVKVLHLFQLPFFRLAGWDIAVGEDGEPIFIEWNSRTELSQTAVGPAFREFTEEVLETSRARPTTRYYILGRKGFND